MYLCFLIELPFSPPCYFHRCFVSRLSSHFQIKRKLPYLPWIRILLESQVPTVKKKEKRKISGFNGAETLPQNAGKAARRGAPHLTAASAPHRRPGSGGVPPPLSLPSPPRQHHSTRSHPAPASGGAGDKGRAGSHPVGTRGLRPTSRGAVGFPLCARPHRQRV